jgi:hypothetical protein
VPEYAARMSRKAKAWGVTIAIVILGCILWSFLRRNEPPIYYVARGAAPPPLTVILAHNNAPVRAFFGPLYVLLILPDGSLWEWGGLGGRTPKIRVPKRIGTNDDWAQAAVADGHYLGIRQDGTLWNWGTPYSWSPLTTFPGPVTPPALPERVGLETNWVRTAASGMHSSVLRRDGTIWAWGDDSLGQMGNGLGPHETNRVKGHSFHEENGNLLADYLHEGRTNLVRVGTNQDWAAISASYGSFTLGLRSNGTVSVWGAMPLLIKNHWTQAVYSVPTQVCVETNWVHLGGSIALNSKREAWQLLYGLPDATAPAEKSCGLLANGCVPGRSAFAHPGMYRIQDDGTLWMAKPLWSSKQHRLFTAKTSQRVGQRSDWVSLDGWMGTAIGVTADGTVWMWGTDVSQEGVEMLPSRIGTLKRKALTLFHAAPSSYSTASIMPVQKEPRPVMHLKFSPESKGRH